MESNKSKKSDKLIKKLGQSDKELQRNENK